MPKTHQQNSYHIVNYHLKDIVALGKPTQNSYVVFWYNSIPLGHLWYIDNSEISTSNFLSDSMDCIEKTLTYYAQHLMLSNQEKLSNCIKNHQFYEIALILDTIDFAAINPYQDISVSIVICTRNRTTLLRKLLQSLEDIQETKEVIVVDNAPDNNSTEELCKEYPEVKYLKELQKGLDKARNKGARHAKNELIAYVDDDVIVPNNWLYEIKKSFSDHLTMCVTGLIIPVSLQKSAEVKFETDFGFNKGYLPIRFNHEYFLNHQEHGVPVWDVGAGANMVFRREAFQLFGYFDERLDVGASGCSGDSEFWYRILAEGWNCYYRPDLIVYHHHRTDFKGLNNQIQNYMSGHVSAVLVQYEKYKHQSNLQYLRKTLPGYYWQRLKLLIADKGAGSFNLWLQIKGCFAGWLYYLNHRKQLPYAIDNKNTYDYLNPLLEIDKDTIVSVIIPCYNHGRYLENCINSVLTQNVNTEIIVVNDGSTDETADICKKYPSIKVINTYRVGLSAARNIGIKLSQGSFLVFLDADDYLEEGGLQANLECFKKNPYSAYVFGTFYKVNDHNEIIFESTKVKLFNSYEVLLYGNHIAMEATVMYKRTLFYHFHFDSKLSACEDYDINLRIARKFQTSNHDSKVAYYRYHETNMSSNKKLMLANVIKVLNYQRKCIKTKDEAKALKKGIRYWKHYYH